MKKLLVIAISLYLVACAQSGGGGSSDGSASNSSNTCQLSAMVGTWTRSVNNTTDQLVLSSNCQVQSNYCGQTGTMAQNSGSQGSIMVTITASNNNPGCLPAGAYLCTYAVSSTSLVYDCSGQGVVSYGRQ